MVALLKKTVKYSYLFKCHLLPGGGIYLAVREGNQVGQEGRKREEKEKEKGKGKEK